MIASGAYAGKSWRADAFHVVPSDDGSFDIMYGVAPDSLATCYTRESADLIVTALRSMTRGEVYALTVNGHRLFGDKAAVLACESAVKRARKT